MRRPITRPRGRATSAGAWALVIGLGGCPARSPPPEPPLTPWEVESPLGDDLDDLDDAPCDALVETPTSTLSSRGAERLAERLLERCELPEGADVDVLVARDFERAADLFFRGLPPLLPAHVEPYPFLDDPERLARARRLFARFLAHKVERGEKDGREPLSEWAPARPLVRRLELACADLRSLEPDAGAAVELWIDLAAAAGCPEADAIDPLKAALRGNSSARAAACRRLDGRSQGLEPEMLRAALDDGGEHKREFKGSVNLGPLVIPTRSTIVASQYPGQDACLEVIERTHGVLVTRTLVDGPDVTLRAIYVGRPRAIVVYTAERGGAATRGYVASSDPGGVPPELAAQVEGAWPKRRKVTPLRVRPLTDASTALTPSGAFTDAAGPHQWDLTLPRNPLPDRIMIVVVDQDGTIQAHFDR
ncbi:MAG: hypothetical protein R3B09_00910 [Nannocystaceae bacterium]